MSISQYTVVTILCSIIMLLYVLCSVQYFMGNTAKTRVRYGNISLHVVFGFSFLAVVIDTLWGACATRNAAGSTVFIIASVAVSTSFAITSYLWYAFVIQYTRKKLNQPLNKVMALITIIPALVASFISLSTPITGAFCEIDGAGEYNPGKLRMVYFAALFFYLILVLINVLATLRKNRSISRGRVFYNVLSFIFPMAICEALQLFFPLFPFFSVGYVASGMIVFVAHLAQYDEEKLRSASLSYENASMEIYNALEALGDTYVSLHLLDLPMGTFETIKTNPILEKAMQTGSNSKECLQLVMDDVVNRSNVTKMLEFVDLDTLSDRMKGERMIFEEFLGVNIGWCVSSFIRVESDQYGNLVKVIHAVQSVNSFKRMEGELNRTVNGELLEKQSVLSNLVKLSSCGLVATDSEYNVLVVNDAGSQLLGFKDAMCTPDKMAALMRNADYDNREEAEKLYRDVTEFGVPFSIEFRIKLGENQVSKIHGDVRRIKISQEKNAVLCAFTRV